MAAPTHLFVNLPNYQKKVGRHQQRRGAPVTDEISVRVVVPPAGRGCEPLDTPAMLLVATPKSLEST